MEQTSVVNTKIQILESAKKSFSVKGYEKSRTREIAKNADVSEALLFKYI
ncbi:MAG: TetR/AcrR family transcriptional regulator [Peptostreptococcaceae bacterium]